MAGGWSYSELGNQTFDSQAAADAALKAWRNDQLTKGTPPANVMVRTYQSGGGSALMTGTQYQRYLADVAAGVQAPAKSANIEEFDPSYHGSNSSAPTPAPTQQAGTNTGGASGVSNTGGGGSVGGGGTIPPPSPAPPAPSDPMAGLQAAGPGQAQANVSLTGGGGPVDLPAVGALRGGLGSRIYPQPSTALAGLRKVY